MQKKTQSLCYTYMYINTWYPLGFTLLHSEWTNSTMLFWRTIWLKLSFEQDQDFLRIIKDLGKGLYVLY